ncbi:Mediator of RNA polymerase II transcription subunit 18 [Candida viswanathii]|uniref:Mediator of RNA polymerase II transcription subunit 18 n=1 Tax=Candida viswanathii TaxID=5486 RepID=A0A367YP96_9ASCO|nr:Mediator of RNA polymerase II transcription subunit 18 [Candida viswanathii]
MVHQLSLVSSIPHNKYLQTISTLQALTGLSQPQSISTYTLLTKPSYAFKPKFEPGKVNQIEQYYMRCVSTWTGQNLADDRKDIDILQPVIAGESNIVVRKLFTGDDNDVERVWTLQVSDIPIAGKNQGCCQQQIYESTLVHTHTSVEVAAGQSGNDAMDIDIVEMKQEEVKQEPVTTETKENGEEKNDVPQLKTEGDNPAEEKKDETGPNADDSDIMEIDAPKEEPATEASKEESKPASDIAPTAIARRDSFLVFLSDLGYEVINQYWLKGIRFFYGDIIIEIYKIFVRDDADLDGTAHGIKLKLLDESNQFQIKTYININKSTEIDLINLGVKELIKLQDALKNLFVLEIPDRMYMDSRVKQ